MGAIFILILAVVVLLSVVCERVCLRLQHRLHLKLWLFDGWCHLEARNVVFLSVYRRLDAVLLFRNFE